jgi:hypothetical protein
VDKKQQVEYTYVGLYILFLLVSIGLSWGLSRVNPRSLRRIVPPLGLFTGLMILGGILLAQHNYPGG